MNEQIHSEEVLNLFKEIDSAPEITQRSLAQKLNISLGKTNYLLQALIKRGSISIKNFTTKDEKLNKVRYILTKKGFEERLHLTSVFLKRKEEEFLRIKSEWDLLQIKQNGNPDGSIKNEKEAA
jgi:EPS-associated MarR family transcriptional regulator